jgi:ankyrin repeat protein
MHPHSSSLMHDAAASGNISVVKWLQTLRLDAHAASDDYQLLPLHYACVRNHMHMAEYLLSLPGAANDIHARSAEGLTPLHCAAQYKADSVVQLLLQRGARTDVKDNRGYTPLIVAGSLPVEKLLLAAGADAAAVTTSGLNVLHHQAKVGACAGTICLLLKAGADPTVTVSVDGISVTQPLLLASMDTLY